MGILNTHKHHDHSAGNGAAKTFFGGIPVIGGAKDNDKAYLKENAFTREVTEGDTLRIGQHTLIDIYEVPCHTRGHVLFLVRDGKGNHPSLFTGDTLFIGGVGHFFEGTAAEMLKNFKKMKGFSKETKVFPGHEYASSNYQFAVFIEPENEGLAERLKWAMAQQKKGAMSIPSTIEIELATNVFMRTEREDVQERLKAKWNEAGEAVTGKVGGRYAVKDIKADTKEWTEADVMGALRHLKTTGYHKKAAKGKM